VTVSFTRSLPSRLTRRACLRESRSLISVVVPAPIENFALPNRRTRLRPEIETALNVRSTTEPAHGPGPSQASLIATLRFARSLSRRADTATEAFGAATC